MKKRETNKMNSFLNTEEVMNRNESIWKMDEVVKNTYDEIVLKLPLVGKYHEAQKKKGNSGTVIKKVSKKEIIDHSVKISESAVSYAVAQKDIVLEQSVKLTKSDLKGLTQVSLYDLLSNFYKVVLPLKTSLKHLEEGEIEKLDQLLKTYKASIPLTGADKDESQTATLNIGESIKVLNKLFDDLDKHIKPYRYKYPDFYSDYFNSRKVIDLKGKSKRATAKSKTA
jgi:hypothetical protein